MLEALASLPAVGPEVKRRVGATGDRIFFWIVMGCGLFVLAALLAAAISMAWGGLLAFRTFGFGFNFDLVVKTEDGEIVAGKDQFATFELTSNTQNREFLVSLTLTLNEAPAGNYVLEYLAHDIASDETATISMPFTISE